MRGFSVLIPFCARGAQRKTPKTRIGGVAFSVVPADFFGFFLGVCYPMRGLLPKYPARCGESVPFADISVTFTVSFAFLVRTWYAIDVGQCGTDGIQQYKKFGKVGTGGAFPFPPSCHWSDTFLPLHKTFFSRPDAGLRPIVNQMTFL